MNICIDPGHGGDHDGAVGPSHTLEKNINLSTARVLRDALAEMGHGALLTREYDTAVPLHVRCEIANKWPADLFISLHCNANANSEYTGVECYTSKGFTAADNWAERFQAALLKAFPDHKDFAGKGTSEENFYVLRNTAMPAVLVEMEFISNPKMELWLKQYYPAVARVIADEIGSANKSTDKPIEV